MRKMVKKGTLVYETWWDVHASKSNSPILFTDWQQQQDHFCSVKNHAAKTTGTEWPQFRANRQSITMKHTEHLVMSFSKKLNGMTYANVYFSKDFCFPEVIVTMYQRALIHKLNKSVKAGIFRFIHQCSVNSDSSGSKHGPGTPGIRKSYPRSL